MGSDLGRSVTRPAKPAGDGWEPCPKCTDGQVYVFPKQDGDQLQQKPCRVCRGRAWVRMARKRGHDV